MTPQALEQIGYFTPHVSTQSGGDAGPNTPSWTYLVMAQRWPLLDALLGGTIAMRQRGEKSLPMWPQEESAQYENRLKRSFLKPFYRDACEKLSAKPFSKPITVKGEVPEGLRILERDADGGNTTLHDFAKAVLFDAVSYGPSYVYVDWTGNRPNPTKTEQRKQRVRAVFKHIKHYDLISATKKETSAGVELVEARVSEQSVEREGYREVFVDRIREFKKDGGLVTVQVWRRDANGGKWIIEQPPTALAVRDIPIRQVLTSPCGFFASTPPLQGLAESNEKHWQLQSDQDNNMAFAGVCMLALRGFHEEEKDSIIFAPGNIVATTRPPNEADVAFLEPQATGIIARGASIEREENYMRVQGIQPLVERATAKTATQAAQDSSDSESILQSWVRQLEGLLRSCYEIAAEYTGETLPDDFAVDVFSSWTIGTASTEELGALQAARAKGDITRKTYLAELQRRGVLADDVDVALEAEAAEEEAGAAFARQMEALAPFEPEPQAGQPAPPKPFPPKPGTPKPQPVGAGGR